MKFGVCCIPEQFEIVKKAGYDYVEMPLCIIADKTDKEFEEYVRPLKECGLMAETFNSFFKSDMRIAGGKVNYSYINDYAEKSFSRAASIGGKVAVFGSGKARNIPKGYDRSRAEEELFNSLNICGDIAGKYGLRIAIEPLNDEETNFINTVGESLEFCRRLNNSNVGVLADFYHVYKTGESLEAIENAGDMLLHVHLARANDDRLIPNIEEDADTCRKWASALKKCGYNKRISLEGLYRPNFEKSIENARKILELFE